MKHATGDRHIPERDLLLAADGELPVDRKAAVQSHLEACWGCRERMRTLEETVVAFVRARNAELDDRIPRAAGPRAQLRSRIAALAEHARPGFRFPRPVFAMAAFACVLLAALVVLQSTVSAEGPKPKSRLTPGETRPITLQEVCRNPDAEVVSRNIPTEMRERVFAAYGIPAQRRDQFEVDYLITPDLGGTESMRNLWPQPYSARWNARVKDRLEQRLHQLVCSGHLDLAKAQREIASDWIGAYRAYVGVGL
jgi:hypothetical protein